MTNQLKLIAERIRSMRDISELSAEEVAHRACMTAEEYLKYENAEIDFSFSALHNIAKVLGIDVTDLITGESPKLSKYILTRAGEGLSIKRNEAYDYKHLALNFKGKLIEPFLVTLNPEDAQPHLNSHEGQEFDYVVSGKLKVILDDTEHILGEGDSLFYNSSLPHAMCALDGKSASFLAIVTE